MDAGKQEDLRVVKTRQAIRNAVKEMICEMDYEQITVKELTARAQINRKTFYLHYRDIEDLMSELQEEVANIFISKEVSYASMQDLEELVRLCFITADQMSPFYERLFCSDSYQVIGDRISRRVMDERAKNSRGIFGLDTLSENLVFAYCGANWKVLYKQWVKDGKQQPLEDLIAIATMLICRGMSGVLGNT